MSKIRNWLSARCLKNTLWAILFTIAFSATALFAQGASKEPTPDSAEKFKSVPMWYLNYRVTLKANGVDVSEGTNGRKTTYTTKLERVINGSMRLGVAVAAPTLSMRDGNAQALFDRLQDFMSWAPGPVPDELKSGEEQYNESIRVMKEDTKVFERYNYRQDIVAEGPSELGGEWGVRTMFETLSGAAPVMSGVGFGLEVDIVKKKYKVSLDHHFVNSEESIEAATGESVDFVGEDRESHLPLKEGIEMGNWGIVSIEPEPAVSNYIVIDGDLPSSVGNLSGESTYLVRLSMPGDQEIKGTLHFSYTLSLDPPEEVELIIEPPSGYEEWRPVAEKSEKITGDLIPIKLVLQKKGGGDPKFKAQQFIYNLRKTSREKGVCMNWPKQPEADSPFDLQFETQYNKDLVLVDQKGQEAQQSVEQKTQGEVNISCFDYGAYGEFEAMAELENGVIVHGVVKGTQDEQLKLPARKDDSNIAKSFNKNLGDLDDDDDSEDDPVGDEFKGDGLALYEEYRGFMDGDNWTPGDPKKKDVFVLNQMRGMPQVLRGIKVFENATGLKVHKLLRDNQVDDGMMINFNHTDAPHVVDQHVIRIKSTAKLTQGGGAHVEEVGTPGTAKSVNMPPDWEEFRPRLGRMIPSFERTTAHEMSHSCNIWHHGEADEDVWWVLTKDPVPQIVEEAPSGRMNIIVQRENGSEITADSFFPANTPEGNGYKIKIGVAHGQHSGAEECLMRYWIAEAYRSNSDPQIRYLSPGEIRGTILCSTTAGTGINAPGHRPQSRYGTAATPANGGPDVAAARGNCKKQLRVNDFGQEPQR